MKYKNNILIINNDPLDLSITALLFSAYEYNVFSAKNEAVAEEYLQTHTPDLIICNLPLPKFNGLEFIDHLRNNILMSIPILIVSTLCMSKLSNGKVQDTTLNYLPKPFLFEDL